MHTRHVYAVGAHLALYTQKHALCATAVCTQYHFVVMPTTYMYPHLLNWDNYLSLDEESKSDKRVGARCALCTLKTYPLRVY